MSDGGERPLRTRKLYIDVVAADGRFAIVYLVAASVAGVVSRYAAIETYTCGGGRTVIHPDWPQWGDDALIDGAPRDEHLVLTDRRRGSVELTLGCSRGHWDPAASPAASLTWRVADLMVGVTLASDGGVLTGVGYSDIVEMATWPRRVGLASVRWGRAHGHDGTALVFNSVRRRDGSCWHAAAVATPDRAVTGLPPICEYGSTETGTVVRVPTTGWSVDIGGGRVLHEGSPFDSERVPKRGERFVSKLATGPAHETRWMAPATIIDPNGRRSAATCVHERVDLG